MSPAEAAKLLTIASAYDNRKPDADQARAWALILDDIRYEDAQVVVIEHFRRSRDWLMPVDIIGAVKRIRAKRIAEHPPVVPPADAHFPTWVADIMRRIGDGETFDPDQFRGELKARDMRELTAGQTIDSGEAVANLRSQVRRPVSPPSKPTDPEHARRKAAALAELDAMRHKTTEPAEEAS